jgi:hypothetical protein|tara:strand:- start:397 stop:813 length:417 start_codon:yes stop_codon:yes gene_type:complete
MSERERVEQLEKVVGVLIGFALAGPAGAKLGHSAVGLHQMSPLHDLEIALGDRALADARRRLAPQGSGRLEESLDFLARAGHRPVRNDGVRKRKPSAYNKRYGKCFKKLAPKFKKKNGSWKKDGFKRCSAAARKCAKK